MNCKSAFIYDFVDDMNIIMIIVLYQNGSIPRNACIACDT